MDEDLDKARTVRMEFISKMINNANNLDYYLFHVDIDRITNYKARFYDSENVVRGEMNGKILCLVAYIQRGTECPEGFKIPDTFQGYKVVSVERLLGEIPSGLQYS